MNNKLDNEYRDSEISVNKEAWIWALPEDLYKPDTIDWLQDEVDAYDFHNDEEFLDFIENSWFDKIYHISVYEHDIDKYKDIKSVYALLDRYKKAAWFEKLQLIIFSKWEDKYLSKDEVDKIISEYADEYLQSDEYLKRKEEIRKQIIEVFKDSYDMSNLSDENVRKKLIEALNQEPYYWRILSNWWKYKYLIWWWKWTKAETWKYYINVLKENWIKMIDIK